MCQYQLVKITKFFAAQPVDGIVLVVIDVAVPVLAEKYSSATPRGFRLVSLELLGRIGS